MQIMLNRNNFVECRYQEMPGTREPVNCSVHHNHAGYLNFTINGQFGCFVYIFNRQVFSGEVASI